ncbi:MAG: hypothetical protein A3H52_03265 [Candidatus Zambryskibacteria bacterium RIFCSPLOWO2_02_FULL_39_26]|uniref:Uncharacterized protein n=1 Tax=Candidatus Zambryskibacteria bacterium RIFCSPLOWO2_12_FULL_39_23 TaxID=1802776 RepID=A0A1G2UTY5_9BACT|nr:MAG: hypothetical protein A3H52_03265 [Candidatus Zambryskibacteria bacterium RIFCSPLOWO2_02_FULL_39_26]OHB12863.1 MAG: hypothetical protein A3G99_02225 [Candidatus Zambryskibacteria bacterium RIFCSPLOWO2_12_FULL_39_23]
MIGININYIGTMRLKYIPVVLLSAVYLFLFSFNITHAEVTQPYTVDEKPQVLFADSVATSTYLGLENYTQDYVGDYAHIKFTYTHRDCCYSVYPPIIHVSSLDPRLNLNPYFANLKSAYFAYFFSETDPSDWYSVDIQFDPTGYQVVVKRAGITEVSNLHTNIVEFTDNDWVYLANNYPISNPPLPYSMSFTPIPVKVVPPVGNSNVLFIPGLMGSRLYENDGVEENELWVSISDSDHSKLSLNSLGKSTNDIYTKDDTQNTGESRETGIINEIFGLNIYESFIGELKDWKQDGTINDYAFIPYDWRLSLSDIITNGATTTGNKLSYSTTTQNFSESFVLKKLEELQQSSNSGKVTIITHSNGGLVAKALVQKLKDTNNPLYDQIDKVILVAVPQIGTPDAMATLLHGTKLGSGWIMDNDRSRQLSENMPTVYNLLPSTSYFTTVDPGFAIDKLASFEDQPFFGPQISQYGVFVSNETELKNYILGTDGRSKPAFSDTLNPNIGNNGLYDQAQNVHQILDSWQPSPNTKVIQVAGWGEETIAGINYKTKKESTETITYKPTVVIDGDGTVVVPSALWMSDSDPNVERWWVDLPSYDTLANFERGHRDILEVSNLRDFLESQIKNSTFSDPDDIVLDSDSTLASNDARLHYTLHSPLTLGVTDSQGRYTGQDPVTREVWEEIPGVNYMQIGEVQFLSVPTDIAHTLKLDGYQTGSFDLDVDEQQGNTIVESTSFEQIPTSPSTLATMEVNLNSDIANLVLEIDSNEDGAVDKSLEATPGGVTIYDDIPPELYVTFDVTNKDVIFSTKDNVDPNPTLTIAGSSVVLADSSENTTVIPFKKLRENSTRFRFTYNQIVRNGLVTQLPNTNIIYNWKEKNSVLTDLDTRVVIKGVEKYIFNYRKAINATIIRERKNGGVVTTTKPGFVIVEVQTEGSGLKVDY